MNPMINPMINLVIDLIKHFYFFVCKARCKCFLGITDFLKKLIDFFGTLNLFNFNSIFAISTVSSFFA